MADNTHIQWTDATWNPITGCRLASEGCRNCYAAGLAATRLAHHPSRAGLARLNAAGEAKFTGEVRLNEQWLDQPQRWRRPRKIFVVAHGDLFFEAVPEEWIDRVFANMDAAPQHQYQILTKRPERMWGYLNRREAIAGYYGVSVEDQAAAEARLPALTEIHPIVRKWASVEPLLGLLDLSPWLPWLDWVVVGCESGPRARPCSLEWIRDLRDQCRAAEVAFFVKQLPGEGRKVLKEIADFPEDLRIREEAP